MYNVIANLSPAWVQCDTTTPRGERKVLSPSRTELSLIAVVAYVVTCDVDEVVLGTGGQGDKRDWLTDIDGNRLMHLLLMGVGRLTD